MPFKKGHKGYTYWKGKKFPKETIEKMKLNHKGMTGKSHSKETIEKIRISNKGKERSAQTRTNMSISRIGIKLSEEHKRNIGVGNKGKKQTESCKEKISKKNKIALKKYYRENPESKIRISNTLKRLIREGKKIHKCKGKTYEEYYGEERANEIKAKIFTTENRKRMLKGLINIPTSFEQKIILLCSKYKLPFIYTGDGRILINSKNPDFVDEENKIIIEVFLNYFKEKVYGSIENYIKVRGDTFAEKGYTTIFIREEEITDKNWENLCLNKIRNTINNE